MQVDYSSAVPVGVGVGVGVTVAVAGTVAVAYDTECFIRMNIKYDIVKGGV